MDVTVIISLLVVQIMACASAEQCPPWEDIYPCKCSLQWSLINIQCNGGSWKEIYEAFDSLRGKIIGEVEFSTVVGDRLPAGLFRDNHVHSLRILRCDLQDLSDTEGRPAFAGLESSLEYLLVWESIKGANQLRTLDMSHLNRLKSLTLDGNNVPEVGNDWFVKGPLNLTSLTIEYCGLSKIGDAAFAPLVNLRYLYLTGNGLTTIQRSVFPNPATHLEWWILNYNHLTGLPNDIFSEMPSLDTVFLRGNSMKRIEETTWSSVWEQLHILDIFDNPLECDSHMEWIFPLKQLSGIYGTCVSPDSHNGVRLEDFIKDNRKSFDPMK